MLKPRWGFSISRLLAFVIRALSHKSEKSLVRHYPNFLGEDGHAKINQVRRDSKFACKPMRWGDDLENDKQNSIWHHEL
jgi:hypothetical protein